MLYTSLKEIVRMLKTTALSKSHIVSISAQLKFLCIQYAAVSLQSSGHCKSSSVPLFPFSFPSFT